MEMSEPYIFSKFLLFWIFLFFSAGNLTSLGIELKFSAEKLVILKSDFSFTLSNTG